MVIDLTSFCVAKYKLNDDAASAVVVDSQGFSNGTYSGGEADTHTIHRAGKINGSFYWGALADKINTNATFQSTFRNNFSMSIWVKPIHGRPPTYDAYFGVSDTSQNNLITLHQTPAGGLYFEYGAGGALTSIETSALFTAGDNTNDWHHIVVVAEQSGSKVKLSIYFDGVFAGSYISDNNITMSNYTNSLNLYIGNYNWSEWDTANDMLFGGLDDTMIFNKALSTDEIAFLYNDGAGTEDLIHYDNIEEVLFSSITMTGNEVMIILSTAKVYLHEIPQGTALPAIVYQQDATGFNDTAQETIALKKKTYQFTCWASTMTGAIALSEALQDVLNATKGIYGNFKVERCRPTNESDAIAETTDENLKRKGRRVDYEVVYQEI